MGVAEIGGFTRFLVEGADAIEWFDGLTAGRIPRVGRTSLAYVSDERGRFLSEFTMTRLTEDSFWLLSAAAAEWHDLDVLTDAHPPESVTITNLTHDHNALMIAGPRSRDVLAAITEAPLDNASFPWPRMAHAAERAPWVVDGNRAALSGREPMSNNAHESERMVFS